MHKFFINRIFKSGTSLVVTIPAQIFSAADFNRGDYVVWNVNPDMSLTLRRVSESEILEAKK